MVCAPTDLYRKIWGIYTVFTFCGKPPPTVGGENVLANNRKRSPIPASPVLTPWAERTFKIPLLLCP